MSTIDKESLLEKSDVFCMLPWVHMCIFPSGEVLPCCITPLDGVMGNLQEQSIFGVWNDKPFRELRQNMLAGRRSSQCVRCYEFEESDAPSQRKTSNRDFGHHFDKVLETAADGSLPQVNMPYMDIRFSNICNFRCRTCGPPLSTGWYADHRIAWGEASVPAKTLQPTKDPEALWRQIEPLVPTLEEIYFSGGEPLLMDEHYRILDLLEKHKLYHVKLRYNTNLSRVHLKDYRILKIWNRFQEVHIGASLEGMGAQAEYMRKGTQWELIERNRLAMKRECPNVKFFISSTLGVFNAFHLPDFHQSWVERGLVNANQFYINLLQFPEFYRIQILPEPLKEKVRERYQKHLDWAERNFEGRTLSYMRDSWGYALRFLNEADYTHKLPEFREVTKKLDKIRSEEFTEVFPELSELMEASFTERAKSLWKGRHEETHATP